MKYRSLAKKKHTPKTTGSHPVKKAAEDRRQVAGTFPFLNTFLYGAAGIVIHLVLSGILVFQTSISTSAVFPFAVLSGVIGAAGTTGFFKKNIITVTWVAMVLVVLHITVNLTLTYEWVQNNSLFSLIANAMTIPLGVLWFFILKVRSEKEVSVEYAYSFEEVFKGITPKIGAAIVIIISATLIFYRLGFYDIWEDENLVINAALGIQENGADYLKDGYKRTWLHSMLIAGVFEIFGDSEYTARLPSALFGIGFVLTCFYVFSRWFGIWILALLIPLLCLMNDRFLILFRYIRMYALLIPIFLAGAFIIYRTVTLKQENTGYLKGKFLQHLPVILSGVLCVAFGLLLAHLHKLSMLILPVFFVFILIYAFHRRSKEAMNTVLFFAGIGLILAFMTFILKMDELRMFRQVTERILTPHQSFPAYFGFMFENGLPVNSTIMTLIAGLGLMNPKSSLPVRFSLILSYLMVIIGLVSMVYLVAGEGRDYRYIAHIVPFLAGIVLLTWYKTGESLMRGAGKWLAIIVLMISSIHLVHDYERVYVRHPWAPSYTIVYSTLKEKYQPGEALFAQNIKSYYLDPEALTGNRYHKLPRNKEYTLEQLKLDFKAAQRGWLVWDQHKSYHWREDVLRYIYSNFQHVHGGQLDDMGVELFYFNESMIR